LGKEDFLGENSASGSSPDGGFTLVHIFHMAEQMLQQMCCTHDVWYQYGFDEANGNFKIIVGAVVLIKIMCLVMLKMVLC
jgi:hypothetical protein